MSVENTVMMAIEAVISKLTISPEAIDSASSSFANAVEKKVNESAEKSGGNIVSNKIKSFTNDLTGKGEGSEEEKGEKQSKALNKVAGILQKGTDMLIGITKKSFEVVSSIFEKMKASSPLLQAIESLFNLAMTLFFMPLGNKLATVLIPLVIELVDEIVAMWDELGDGGIDEMFNKAMDYGISKFSKFFEKISETFSKSSNSFLQALSKIAGFISQIIPVVPKVISFATWIISNLPLLIGVIVTLMGTMITLQIAALVAQMAGPLGFLGGLGVLVGGTVALGAGIAAGGLASKTLSSGSDSEVPAMASGGYVPATEGGSLRVLGEGGEGEYVIPESKMNGIRGGGNVTYNIYGYTDSELRTIIRETVDEQTQLAGIRSGF